METDSLGKETEYTYTIKRDGSGNLVTYSAVNAETGQLNFRKDYRNTYDANGLLTAVEVTDENGGRSTSRVSSTAERWRRPPPPTSTIRMAC